MILKHIHELNKGGWLIDLPDVLDLLDSEYCETLNNCYKDLNTNVLYKSIIHGQDHVERVMLFGAIIAMKQNLFVADTRLLLIACSYHDIGRINDFADPEHGMRGAENLGGLVADLPDADRRIVQAAIAAHSLDDCEINGCMKAFGVTDPERCTLIFKCLKDADALDRVRFNGLNENYLRLDESKKIAEYAKKILTKDYMGDYIYK